MNGICFLVSTFNAFYSRRTFFVNSVVVKMVERDSPLANFGNQI